MKTEIIIAIAALLGTVIGAAIPSISGMIDSQINHKNSRKEKYESIIRSILSEYFPVVERSLNFAKDYKKNLPKVILDIEVKSMKYTNDFFEQEVKSKLPLDILEDMAELNQKLLVIENKIDFDIDEYYELNDSFKEDIESAEKKLQKLKKKIKVDYI